MPPWWVAALVEGAIPFVGGVYATLLAFRLVGPKPGVNPKQDDWHRRWGGFMRVAGPLLVVFALFLWVKGIVYQHGSAPTPANVWVRHNSSDGVASVEFPAPPQAMSKEAKGVVMHNMTLYQKEFDRHFFLSWFEVTSQDGVTDEERLDRFRESIPATAAQIGTSLNFLSEEKFSEGEAAGRVLTFDGNGKFSYRVKCVIQNGRYYWAGATLHRNQQDEADSARFISSFRLVKTDK